MKRTEAKLGRSRKKRVDFGAVYRVRISAAQRKRLQVSKDDGKDLGIGIGLRHGDPDVADCQTDLTSDLEELQADRLALSAGQIEDVLVDLEQRSQIEQ